MRLSEFLLDEFGEGNPARIPVGVAIGFTVMGIAVLFLAFMIGFALLAAFIEAPLITSLIVGPLLAVSVGGYRWVRSLGQTRKEGV